MHLARAYSSLKQHPKAALLAERAVVYARQARVAFKPTPDELDGSLHPLGLTDDDVDRFDAEVKAARQQIGKAWFAAGPDADPAEGVAGMSLDPDAAKKRNKPLFFDIAVNYATHPDLDEIARRAGQAAGQVPTEVEGAPVSPTALAMDVDNRVESTKEAVQQPAKKGIWGWLGR
jgi:hypothetical protein